jgi:hypothetical protein
MYLCHNFAYFAEVCTSTHITLRQEILDEPRANVVSHLLELFIHFLIVLVILDELYNQCTVRKSKEFCILPLDVRYNLKLRRK